MAEEKTSPLTWGCLFLVAFVVVVVLSSRPSASDREAATRNGSETGALVECEHAVTDRLKAPSTAKFAGPGEYRVTTDGKGYWIVISHVDAQNAYGAMLRNRIACQLHFRDGTFKVDSVTIATR